jgi:hypothetical protein
MDYDNDMPEFLQKRAVNYVNERFDITNEQSERLRDYKERLKIPPSAIVRIALDCFFPRLTNMNFKEEGIKNLWNDKKF